MWKINKKFLEILKEIYYISLSFCFIIYMFKIITHSFSTINLVVISRVVNCLDCANNPAFVLEYRSLLMNSPRVVYLKNYFL
jgi:hypothetical protein